MNKIITELNVNDRLVGIMKVGNIDYICLTDIAFEFASWISLEFERLKVNEAYQNKIEWSVRRSLSKTNYRIHTDTIKENIVLLLTNKQKQYVYVDEVGMKVCSQTLLF